MIILFLTLLSLVPFCSYSYARPQDPVGLGNLPLTQTLPPTSHLKLKEKAFILKINPKDTTLIPATIENCNSTQDAKLRIPAGFWVFGEKSGERIWVDVMQKAEGSKKESPTPSPEATWMMELSPNEQGHFLFSVDVKEAENLKNEKYTGSLILLNDKNLHDKWNAAVTLQSRDYKTRWELGGLFGCVFAGAGISLLLGRFLPAMSKRVRNRTEIGELSRRLDSIKTEFYTLEVQGRLRALLYEARQWNDFWFFSGSAPEKEQKVVSRIKEVEQKLALLEEIQNMYTVIQKTDLVPIGLEKRVKDQLEWAIYYLWMGDVQSAGKAHTTASETFKLADYEVRLSEKIDKLKISDEPEGSNMQKEFVDLLKYEKQVAAPLEKMKDSLKTPPVDTKLVMNADILYLKVELIEEFKVLAQDFPADKGKWAKKLLEFLRYNKLPEAVDFLNGIRGGGVTVEKIKEQVSKGRFDIECSPLVPKARILTTFKAALFDPTCDISILTDKFDFIWEISYTVKKFGFIRKTKKYLYKGKEVMHVFREQACNHQIKVEVFLNAPDPLSEGKQQKKQIKHQKIKLGEDIRRLEVGTPPKLSQALLWIDLGSWVGTFLIAGVSSYMTWKAELIHLPTWTALFMAFWWSFGLEQGKTRFLDTFKGTEEKLKG